MPGTSASGQGTTNGSWRLVLTATVVLTVPLVIALVALRRPVWTPVLDLAMTELRVRDVGGRHTPLIGLPGRIGTLERQGSHPGPLSFYALAPTYRLLGSSAWALQVGSVLVHVVALGTALAVTARRGGATLVLAMAVLLAALTAGYGGGTLTEPWNPYLPLLWWVVVLLAAWSVLCGDLPMLPVLVVAGSFCAQTHIPYLGLTLGLGALGVAAAAFQGWRHPHRRRAAARWGGAALGAGLLLWLPPTVDQVRHDPGNYELLVEHFTDPPEEPKGLGDGVEVGLRYLDLSHLVRADVTSPGWLVTDADGNLPTAERGGVLLLVWAVAAGVAIRRRHRALMALHAVVGSGIVLMVLAISRIFGVVWYYLTLWGWAIGLLTLLAVVWTAADVVGERWSADRRARTLRHAAVGLAVLGLGLVARFAVAAPDSPHADPNVAEELAAVADEAAAGLESGAGVSTGTDGRYLLMWSDAFHIGSQGYGLLSELERRGFDIGVQEGRRVPATAHRVVAAAEATAQVHLATGVFVERWQQLPTAVQVAFHDPRSPAERAEQAALRAEVVEALQDRGLDDLVLAVDENLFGAAIDDRVPEAVQIQMGRMLRIGAPLAVFVAPVGVAL